MSPFTRFRASFRAFRHLLITSAMLGIGATLLPPIAAAQHGDAAGTEPDPATRARMGVARLGKNWNADAFAETVRLYTELHRHIEWPGLRPPETFGYGPDTKQSLTLYRPEQGFNEPSFVLLFLHGNGLGSSDEVAPGSDGLIYSHLGKLAATFGGIGITANYRSGPGVPARAGAEDLALILDWAHANAARYGGDPGTILLIANSDGATHAAGYLFDETLQPESGPGVALAILSSGRFGELAPHLGALVDDYTGPRVPLALWSAEYDPPSVEIGIADLFAQLCRKYSDCPMFAQIPGHNQVSHVMSLGTGDTEVQNLLIRTYHTVR